MPLPFIIGGLIALGSGATIAGTAATIGTVAASTVIGSAVIGTMGTAGTATASGAIGAVNGISGATKLSEASEIKDKAIDDYNFEKENLERIYKWTNNTLKNLGKDKLKIWGSFERFSSMYSKIQNPPVMNGSVKEESIILTQDELDIVKDVALSAKDVIMMAAVAGTMASNGMPIVSGLMVGGILLNGKGNKALENAQDIKYKADQAIEKMKTAETELHKVQSLAKQIQDELRYLNRFYTRFMDEMENIVARKTDYRVFTYEEKKSLEKTVLALKLLKQLSMQNILDPQKENVILTEDVNRTLKYVSRTRREKLAA